MENLKTRFNNLRYEHFKVEFKGLVIEIKLLDNKATFPNSDNKDLCEEFKISVTHKDKTISYKFYNSVMEREISDILANEIYTINWSQTKQYLKTRPLKMWGGYDEDLKSSKTLEYARIKHLLYSVLNCFALDKETETESFKFFCDNFGYDEDSIKAEKIYKAVLEMKAKIYDLKLTEKQETYFNEEANQETDKFKQDVYTSVDNAKDI